MLSANLSHFTLLHEGQRFQQARYAWPKVAQAVRLCGQDDYCDVEARQILLKRQVPISSQTPPAKRVA
jgi:hypothetical protein